MQEADLISERVRFQCQVEWHRAIRRGDGDDGLVVAVKLCTIHGGYLITYFDIYSESFNKHL